jgi:hypothetical protein
MFLTSMAMSRSSTTRASMMMAYCYILVAGLAILKGDDRLPEMTRPPVSTR